MAGATLVSLGLVSVACLMWLSLAFKGALGKQHMMLVERILTTRPDHSEQARSPAQLLSSQHAELLKRQDSLRTLAAELAGCEQARASGASRLQTFQVN